MVAVATVEDVIRIARSEIGYVEQGGPHGNDGNVTKFWADLIEAKLAGPEFQRQPYCAGYIVWTDWKANAPILPISNPYYCPSRVQYARSHDLWDVDGLYLPGDEVFYSFNGDGVADHVERVLADDGTTILTVGANTSPDDRGSQANGGGVYERHRLHGPTVLGVLAYNRLLTHVHNGGKVPRKSVKKNPFRATTRILELRHPWMTGNSVRWAQWALGAPVDGVFGPQTAKTVRHFQHQHGLVVDGVVGPRTRAALARVTH